MADKIYKAIGLMSGSSLDGLDLAYCEFRLEGSTLDWQLVQGETIAFSDTWKSRLAHLAQQSAHIYAKTHVYLGYYFGELCNDFIKRHNLQVDFIASHGHTIFHAPELKYSAQIGDGAAIAASTGICTIDNFRIQDIALNGEGAPIAPIADQYLLPGYDFYLNLGGIVNVSCDTKRHFIAFDITGANQVLNLLANEAGKRYDEFGQMAASGKLITALFDEANQLEYLKAFYPKSLSNQWVQTELIPLFSNHDASLSDRMCTMVHHIAFQIQQALQLIIKKEDLRQTNYKMIATGGGAYNQFLVKTIQSYNPNINLDIPEKSIIDFKEAALMALMGVLRMENIPNTIHSVTGATRDTISGAIHAGSPAF